jgi:hypothetical protein
MGGMMTPRDGPPLIDERGSTIVDLPAAKVK